MRANSIVVIVCLFGCHSTINEGHSYFPAKIKADIRSGATLKYADERLTSCGYKLIKVSKDKTLVKDKSGDEPLSVELSGDRYHRYSRKESDLIVTTISIAVLVVDDHDMVSGVYTWQEFIGP